MTYVNYVYVVLDADTVPNQPENLSFFGKFLGAVGKKFPFTQKFPLIGKLFAKKAEILKKLEENELQYKKLSQEATKLSAEVDKSKRNLVSKLLIKFGLLLLRYIAVVNEAVIEYFKKLDELKKYAEERKQNAEKANASLEVDLNFEAIQDAQNEEDKKNFIVKALASLTVKAPPLATILLVLLILGQAVAAGIAWAIFKALKFEPGLKLISFKAIFNNLLEVIKSFGTSLVRLWPAMLKTFDEIKARFEKAKTTEKSSTEIVNDIGGFFKKIVDGIVNLVKKIFSAKGLLIAAIGFAVVLALIGLIGYDKLEALLGNTNQEG